MNAFRRSTARPGQPIHCFRAVVAALLLMAALCAVAAADIRAQVARRPVLPRGALFLAVGNQAPLDRLPERWAYGGVLQGSGSAKYSDGSQLNVDQSALVVGLDVPAPDSVVSVGVSSGSTRFEEVGVSSPASVESGSRELMIRYTQRAGALGAVAVQLGQVTETLGVTVYGDTVSASASYVDFTLGGSVALDERAVIGFGLSPAVSAKGTGTSTLGTLTFAAGHGDTIYAGLGINLERATFGLEGQLRNESPAADSPGRTDVFATAEVLAGDSAFLGGSVGQTHYFSASASYVETHAQWYALRGGIQVQEVVLRVELERYRETPDEMPVYAGLESYEFNTVSLDLLMSF